jgi:ABC-type uncharacterized transport system permease subunit
MLDGPQICKMVSFYKEASDAILWTVFNIHNLRSPLLAPSVVLPRCSFQIGPVAPFRSAS